MIEKHPDIDHMLKAALNEQFPHRLDDLWNIPLYFEDVVCECAWCAV